MSKIQNITLSIPEMHCKSCIKLVEATLNEIPTVKVTKADFDKKIVKASFDPIRTKIEQILINIKEIGYTAEII